MSNPSSDPPQQPSQPPAGEEKVGEASTSAQAPPPAASGNPEGEDVKMEEVKSKEDTLEDIPESVIKVSAEAVWRDVALFL